jgi:hypothetical protein
MALALVACGTVSPPVDLTSGDLVTLYYIQSQRLEPWGAHVRGGLPINYVTDTLPK